MIVVGTKMDLNDEAVIQRLVQTGQHTVMFEEGNAKSEEVNALRYFECSALLKDGVQQTFNAAVTVSLRRGRRYADPHPYTCPFG